VAMLAAETLAREASAARNSVALHVKDVKDWATLVVREVLERMSRVEVENAVALASAREDAECLIQKIVLHQGELAAVHQAQEVSERECQEQYEELTLLQTWASELCHAVVSPPQARHHLSEGMWFATLHHTEMARELAMLWAVVSSAMESMLGHSPSDTFRVG
jgi:hypothetical protein